MWHPAKTTTRKSLCFWCIASSWPHAHVIMPPCIWASYKTLFHLVLISSALLIVFASWYCIWFLIYCLNAQVELGAYLLLTPPPFLSSPHHSTIPPYMSIATYLVLPLAHVGWDGSNSIPHALILASCCFHITGLWEPHGHLCMPCEWNPFLASICVVLGIFSCLE